MSNRVPANAGPRFYVTGRQPLRPATILLATAGAVVALSSVLYALGHSGHVRLAANKAGSARSGSASGGTSADEDDNDDPSQVDTIVLGAPTEAPVPASRRAGHPSSVHPFVVVRLPRTGDQVGRIPDTPAGRLLYAWLAAFNQANYAGLREALPNDAGESAAAAQMQLREQTGGFNLISAREVQPGVLVFRLLEQSPTGTEALGTLQVEPNSNPAAVASFSLRGVPRPPGPRSLTPATAPPE